MSATSTFGGSVFSSPFSGGAGSGPFGGMTSFGFEIPQGNPGELESAGAGASAAALGFTTRAQDVVSAARTATAGWEGDAEVAFVEYSGQVVSVFNANADALGRAGSALSKFAQELEQAQKLTREAAEQCQHYQNEMNTQSGQASAHGQTAQTLYQQASAAAHPQVQGDLVRQAKSAEAQQQAASNAANAAKGQLEAWEKRGRDAYHAYMQQAQATATQIQGLAQEIRSIPALPGGAPVPISVSPSNIAFAAAILPTAAGVPGSAWANNPGQEFRRLSGRALTPSEVLAVYQLAEQEQAKGKGSLFDAAGGFLNTVTFGAVSFGDPNSPRYRGGEMAAMIPIDPESLVIDADKAGVKLAAEDSGRIDYSQGFDSSIKESFADGTASVHAGPLDHDLILVQYSDKAGGGSYKWWTSTYDANNMPTVKDVMDKLALEPSWGNRDAASVAHVPAGTDVTVIHGEAKPQITTPGGGQQYRFRDFDPRWIVKTRPLP
jgi:hypothetical protein